jgi:hypothetical protein
LLDTLIRHSKNREDNVLRSPKVKENQQIQNIKPVLQQKKRPVQSAKGNVGRTVTRTLTLKQLRDTINDIYQNKIKYD